MGKTTLKAGSKYSGPKAIFDGEEVDGILAFYALDQDGKTLLKQNGKPVRLMQVDEAPGDPDDGSESFYVAAKGDPAQKTTRDEGNLVELEPEEAQGAATAGLGG
jgi:hypothetical protein